jgi:hypothetical protein
MTRDGDEAKRVHPIQEVEGKLATRTFEIDGALNWKT